MNGRPSAQEVFQSTHPRGVRLGAASYSLLPCWCFNPRTRVGCDMHRMHDGSNERRFNPRTRVGCDHNGSRRGHDVPRFNPRTRVGCDFFTFFITCSLKIVSIHAPAWGATVSAAWADIIEDVSIHAPAWGATGRGDGKGSRRSCFNPRTRVGCDVILGEQQRRLGAVSIHAPAWGATAGRGHTDQRTEGFNPRTRVGCDISAALSLRPLKMFQSTHPRGVRPRQDDDQQLAGRVSIHAPAWGATSRNFPQNILTIGFNPRTRVGCDVSERRLLSNVLPFQSTHPRGVRPMPRRARNTWTNGFNPRTRVGCDIRRNRHSQSEHVSIHAPAWGATEDDDRDDDKP